MRTSEDTMIDPSIAEFDDILSGIQNSLDSKRTTEPESKENDLLPTSEGINRAKKILKQFMEMKFATLVHPGISDLKDSLSVLLSTKNVFPKDTVDEMTKFSETFDQNCHRYETAQEDLKEANRKENSLAQLDYTLKQYASKLKPMKPKVEAIDPEIADLEKQMIEKKTAREKLKSTFEELKGQATSSKEALMKALRDVELVAKRKKEAEDFVKEVEDGWQTLVARCSQHIWLL